MSRPIQTAWVVDTGVANFASVTAALRRVGMNVQVGPHPDVARFASFVVLPGVGAFGAGRERLREGLDDALLDRIAADRPTLAICLGMQLLCEGSDESPMERGLGVLPGRAVAFPEERVPVPQLGWNRVAADGGAPRLESGFAYFANSYGLRERPAEFACAVAEYAGPFVAAVERGALLACQFHPELSGRFGHDLLERWAAA